jgi:hypothetical protein
MPLLGSGFQRRTFPFLCVPELSLASATIFTLLTIATLNWLRSRNMSEMKFLWLSTYQILYGSAPLSYMYIFTYSQFAWLTRRVLYLMIKFIGPLHNRLQQFTNHYLTHSHLPTGHSTGTILTSYWTRLYSVVLLPFSLYYSDCTIL